MEKEIWILDFFPFVKLYSNSNISQQELFPSFFKPKEPFRAAKGELYLREPKNSPSVR